MRKAAYALVIIAFLILSGCSGKLGLKSDINDCNGLEDKEKLSCYREVAITLAANGNIDKAREACNRMDPTLLPQADPAYMSLQRNLCLYDVATTANDEVTCTLMSADATGSILTGSSATQELCIKKVQNAKLARQYKCSLLFGFPILLFYAFYANRKQDEV